MDELSRALRAELERRDETILALEMLVVDQASRLLALESLVLETMSAERVDLPAVHRRITSAAERFRERFEAIDGFAERAQRIASEMIGAAGTFGSKGRRIPIKGKSPAKPRAKRTPPKAKRR